LDENTTSVARGSRRSEARPFITSTATYRAIRVDQ
jgi:hypothetical protein